MVRRIVFGFHAAHFFCFDTFVEILFRELMLREIALRHYVHYLKEMGEQKLLVEFMK